MAALQGSRRRSPASRRSFFPSRQAPGDRANERVQDLISQRTCPGLVYFGSPKTCYHFLVGPMRRFAVHLVLAAMYAGLFAPLLVQEQSLVHACCLRSGAHHCQRRTSETEFRSARSLCPYSQSVAVTTVSNAAEWWRFEIRLPGKARVLPTPAARLRTTAEISGLSARAPPACLV
jgi:hypothetical protein